MSESQSVESILLGVAAPDKAHGRHAGRSRRVEVERARARDAEIEGRVRGTAASWR